MHGAVYNSRDGGGIALVAVGSNDAGEGRDGKSLDESLGEHCG